jgi:hypothetical protein
LNLSFGADFPDRQPIAENSLGLIDWRIHEARIENTKKSKCLAINDPIFLCFVGVCWVLSEKYKLAIPDEPT